MVRYNPICLVWQANPGGSWDIYSRFNHNGTNWSRLIPVANTRYPEMNPSVSYDPARNRWWCAFQAMDTIAIYKIYVSYGDSLNGWSTPVQISSSPGDDQKPTIICDNDTVWVAWQVFSGLGININARYYDGNNWSQILRVTNDSIMANTEQDFGVRHGRPFLAWEKENEIYYSEYAGGAWITPVRITNNSFIDSRPRAYSYPSNDGVAIAWHTNRDGNLEIYRTEVDSFNQQIRMTVDDSADINPTGLYFLVPVKDQTPTCLLWTSSRNGNKDIYSRLFTTVMPVDTNRAEDDFVVASIVTTSMNYNYVWAIWQSSRSGNSDIYGAYYYYSLGVDELPDCQLRQERVLLVNPNPARERLRIDYSLRIEGLARLRILDASGRVVKTLVEETQMKGNHKVVVKKALPAGVYFIELSTSSQVTTGKVVILQ